MKPHYQNILELENLINTTLEYIKSHPEETSNALMDLIYIEAFLDNSGRGQVFTSVKDSGAGIDKAQELMHQTNEILDTLRKKIRELIQAGDFDEVLKYNSEAIYRNWQKR